MTLPGSSPAARRCIVASTSSSSTSSGSISCVERQRARREQLERGREPLGVVVVRADDRQLEHDRAVVVDARHVVAGPDEHERARVVELVERRLRRGRVARALERDRVRLGDRAGPSARAADRSGAITRRRTDRERALAPRAAPAPKR